MIILGSGLKNDALIEIARKAGVSAEATPASNVVKAKVKDDIELNKLVQTAKDLGYAARWSENGQGLVIGGM